MVEIVNKIVSLTETGGVADANPVLEFMLSRRSTVARLLGDPGPGDAELATILTAAARVPDHGKLAPWRFVIIRGAARAQLGEAMVAIFSAANPDAEAHKLEEERGRALRAPVIVAIVSTAAEHPKIPLWEQQLSAGAACQNLLSAAIAMGFGAQWVTEWWAFDRAAAGVLGLSDAERIAGFVYIGTYDKPLQDRPRPDLEAIVSEWTGGS